MACSSSAEKTISSAVWSSASPRLLNWPLENGEGMQVLHYRPGAEYKPHYDYFAPNEPGTPTILKRGGQRVGTLVMYLNEPARRRNHLSRCRAAGRSAPWQCRILQLQPARPGDQDPARRRSRAGGRKWIATKWLREREFK
jgi:prolyl 4-hydroxylase